jgi:hypothetical protein
MRAETDEKPDVSLAVVTRLVSRHEISRRRLCLASSQVAMGNVADGAGSRRSPTACYCPSGASLRLIAIPIVPADCEIGRSRSWRTRSLTPDESSSATAAGIFARSGLRIIRTMR